MFGARLLVSLLLASYAQSALAHGIAGKPFFPGTLSFDDPAGRPAPSQTTLWRIKPFRSFRERIIYNSRYDSRSNQAGDQDSRNRMSVERFESITDDDFQLFEEAPRPRSLQLTPGARHQFRRSQRTAIWTPQVGMRDRRLSKRVPEEQSRPVQREEAIEALKGD